MGKDIGIEVERVPLSTAINTPNTHHLGYDGLGVFVSREASEDVMKLREENMGNASVRARRRREEWRTQGRLGHHIRCSISARWWTCWRSVVSAHETHFPFVVQAGPLRMSSRRPARICSSPLVRLICV